MPYMGLSTRTNAGAALNDRNDVAAATAFAIGGRVSGIVGHVLVAKLAAGR